MKTAYLVLSFAFIAIQISCETEQKIENNHSEKNKFVNPPLPQADVPYQTDEVHAETGDTLFFTSGAVIVIPPNSVLDEEGKLVHGNVQFKYREFLDPLDIYLSGIPMTFEYNDNTMNFESVYMCDVQAYQNNKPLQVNPNAKPKVYVPNSNSDTVPNLYYLDTIAQKWVQEGKDEIVDVNKLEESKNRITIANIPYEPVKPSMTNGDRPVFYINIDSSSAPELLAYNNLEFEIDKRDTNYKYHYSDILWTDIDIDKNEEHGLYDVRFRSPTRQVTFITRPVLKGKDYEEAIKLYEEKRKIYDERLTERIKQENEIRIRNDEIKAYNKILEAGEIAMKKRMDSIHKERQKNSKKAFQAGGQRMEGEIIRTLNIARFGIHNIDKIIRNIGSIVAADFRDNRNNKIEIKEPTVVYAYRRMIYRHASNNLNLYPNKEHMIWGVIDKKFAYLTFEDFKQYDLSKYSDSVIFTMRVHDGEITSREQIREILNI